MSNKVIMHMENKYKDLRKLLILPGKWIVIFLVFTMLLYFFGPIIWKIDNGLILFLYLSVSYGAIWLGYNKYMKRAKSKLHYISQENFSENESNARFPNNLIVFRILLIFVFLWHGKFSVNGIFIYKKWSTIISLLK